MGWMRTLLRWWDSPPPGFAAPEPRETFSVELSTPVDRLIRGTVYGETAPVSRRLALSVPGVLRGRNLLCSIATLPLVTRGRDRMVVRNPLLEQIDPNVANVVTLSQTVEDLLFDAIAWWQVTERAPNGFPRYAIHVDQHRVSLLPPAGTPPLQTLPSGVYPVGVVWVDGKPVDGRNMIRFDSPNPGVLTAAARAIRRAVLFERAAEMYAADPRPQDYFTPTDGLDPASDEEIEEILDEWRESRRDRTTAYIPAALTYNTVTSPTPADLQLIELRKQAVIDIANALGLDSEDLQVSTTSRTYANAVDRRRDRVNDVLAPLMRAITDRLSMGDITRRTEHVEFDLNDYMKSNPTERWSTYKSGLSDGVVSVEEVREMEGLPAVPVEPARRPVRPPVPARLNPSDVDTPPSEETAMTRNPAGYAVRGAQFSTDTEATTRIAFEIPEADAQFRVNRAARTISGLMLPWNTIARNGFARWRFTPNSLTWSQTSRVKLNRDHDRRQMVGYATQLVDTDVGLVGTFKIARGAAGDEVLTLAEDQVLDGFSVEVDFEADGSSWERDPDDDMVRLVQSGQLVGAAITGVPAFDDARVSGVAATRNTHQDRKDPAMPEATGTKNGTKQDPPAAGPDTATVAAFTAAVEAFTAQAADQTAAFHDALAQLVEVQQNGGPGPASVDPTRPGTARFGVTEEAPYRFDGSMGKHDFSGDIIAGAKGDYEALKRAQTWISEHFAVTSSNVVSLNPTVQRPDLYVDQVQWPSPIWDAINKGTIENNTPFVLPKFNTSSGLVNDHTEGVEPTPGALTTTSQTITPSAVSGKVEVTREAWDQGGNPQLSTILWRQMTRAYVEALEQAAAALLVSLSVTTVALTAGSVDAVLASQVKRMLAALHFTRGGFRFRDFPMEQGLYTALADAKDADGRPLFPVLGPANADGQMSPYFGAISVAGLAGSPAWALPYTGGSPNASFLFNREDVHGWASTPQRLDFEYRVAFVDVAIWGYKALACTRTDGVRKITYDTTA